jgi:hypothetical protein
VALCLLNRALGCSGQPYSLAYFVEVKIPCPFALARQCRAGHAQQTGPTLVSPLDPAGCDEASVGRSTVPRSTRADPICGRGQHSVSENRRPTVDDRDGLQGVRSGSSRSLAHPNASEWPYPKPKLSALTPVSASGTLPCSTQFRSPAASLLPPIASLSAMLQAAFFSEVLQRPFVTR